MKRINVRGYFERPADERLERVSNSGDSPEPVPASGPIGVAGEIPDPSYNAVFGLWWKRWKESRRR
jgi:hypothetical protein